LAEQNCHPTITVVVRLVICDTAWRSNAQCLPIPYLAWQFSSVAKC